MMYVDCDKDKADSLYKQLTKLQAYMTGWRDAGKMTPPGYEAVWQLRNILKDATFTEEEKSSLGNIIARYDEIDEIMVEHGDDMARYKRVEDD